MKTVIALSGGLLLLAASAAYAADNESRTYGNAACSDRNAKPADCVIDNGPPRRRNPQQEVPPPDNEKRDGKSTSPGPTDRK